MNRGLKVAMFAVMVAMIGLVGCKITVSLSDASIPADAKTFSVGYFPNNAAMVNPALSTSLTEAMKERFRRQTKLSQVDEEGDLAFQGDITGYTSVPTSITGDEMAAENRLTITVRVTYVSKYSPEWNYSRSFSSHINYPSTMSLQEAESSFTDEMISILVEDIFNAAVANW